MECEKKYPFQPKTTFDLFAVCMYVCKREEVLSQENATYLRPHAAQSDHVGGEQKKMSEPNRPNMPVLMLPSSLEKNDAGENSDGVADDDERSDCEGECSFRRLM